MKQGWQAEQLTHYLTLFRCLQFFRYTFIRGYV